MYDEIIIKNMSQLNAEMAKHPEYTPRTAEMIRKRVRDGLRMGYEVTYKVL